MLKKENRNDFKKELLIVHKKDRRDFSLTIKEDEIELKNGLWIVVPDDENKVVLTAAKDFSDYLFVSMKISSLLVYDKSLGQFVTLSIDKDIDEEARGFMGYKIEITDGGIDIKGYDDRCVAQALYYVEDLINSRKAPFM